jgi:hypothetical protein
MPELGSGFPPEEEPTRPDATNQTSWGRLAAVVADLSEHDAREAIEIILDWQKCGPNGRALLRALARELGEKEAKG